MSHDYSQYEDVDTEAHLRWVAECKTCGWMNRRDYKRNAKRSGRVHERENVGHSVTVEERESPLDNAKERFEIDL